MTPYKSIDISTWQGSIDWTKAKRYGIKGVMIRSSYGRGTKDDKFDNHIRIE